MKKLTILLILTIGFGLILNAQDKLYPNQFPLTDVTLLNGPFKTAQDLNVSTLLKYDINRLLAPYMKAAGLTPRGESYLNWIGLDGHVGGHYLSAMAIHYASTGNTRFKERMDSMLVDLKLCEIANGVDTNFIGYLGGVPDGKTIWRKIRNGDPTAVASGWVPWYNVHKMYAGLRDAWLYAGNDTAKNMFLRFCDWGIKICSKLTDAQMETMMGTEHGGMNEVYADAYQMTGNAKYLTMAKRFSHKALLNSMIAQIDNLDNMHANTQVPKAVGFQRIAELAGDVSYTKAARFFWQTVTLKRSLAFGGNSRKEFFPQANACNDYITDREGPESCNTNNMLKLTEGLFRMKSEAKYADFYEKALYNHILSTQHPEHGGYVYFTPARPQHYRVYSALNTAMWCCVGTGMENHGKYGEFIYTHHEDTLFLNLFAASELNWKTKGVQIKQETTFPEEESTKITVNVSTPTSFKLLVRHPSWVPEGALKIILGTDTLNITSKPSTYAVIDRTWNGGEVIKVLLPMQNYFQVLPNVSRYIALMHGPILLSAKTGTDNMDGLIADDSRWGHIANGSLVSLNTAPIMLGDRSTFMPKIKPVAGQPLTFKTSGLFATAADSQLIFEPFYKIHDSRYLMYCMALTQAQYQTVVDSLAKVEATKLILDARTVDAVAPGEQQPEVNHKLQSLNSYTGNHMNEFWRDARNGGYISYNMLTKKETKLSLMVRYWGAETGSRAFDILINNVKLVSENIVGKWNKSAFVDVEYAIPDNMVTGKDSIRVRFQAAPANIVGGLFYVRILRNVPNNAGAINGANGVCLNTKGAVYSIPAISGATSYKWMLPDGASGQSTTNSITLDFGDTIVADTLIVQGVNSYSAGKASTLIIPVSSKPAKPAIVNNQGNLESSSVFGNQWFRNDTLIVGATAQNYSPFYSGSYRVIVSVNGCVSDTSDAIALTYTGFNTIKQQQMSIYPNPTTGVVYIKFTQSERCNIEVLNNQGAVVQVFPIARKAKSAQIDLSHFPSGMYIVKIKTLNGEVLEKVVKQ